MIYNEAPMNKDDRLKNENRVSEEIFKKGICRYPKKNIQYKLNT